MLAVVPAAGGYVVEVGYPLALVEKAIEAPIASGVSFPLAFGVDDADVAKGTRTGQIYFPKTWVHSDPSTFATATFQ